VGVVSGSKKHDGRRQEREVVNKYIGAHVSIAGGVENAPGNAERIGAKAFAMFTKNQRQWQAPPLGERSIKAFRENLMRVGIKREHVLPHDGYLINLGNPDPEKRQTSLNAFIDEAQRV
jgi:deoxyribonuclease-4